MIEADAYTPESMEILKRVVNRAIRHLTNPTGEQRQAFKAASKTLAMIEPESLSLPLETHFRLIALVARLRGNYWQDNPGAGADAIKRFYFDLNHEMRRLGLLNNRT